MEGLTAGLLWRLFESTGSIWAYLAYRRLVPVAQVLFCKISLN